MRKLSPAHTVFVFLVVCAAALVWACGGGDPAGEPCDENEDCESKICARLPNLGRVCAAVCNDKTDCPAEWFCLRPKAFRSPQPICVPVQTGIELQEDEDSKELP